MPPGPPGRAGGREPVSSVAPVASGYERSLRPWLALLHPAQSARAHSVRASSVVPEVRDVAPGLWLWRIEHPAWEPGLEWEPLVTSTCVESRGEVALLDPLSPADDAD